MKSKTETFASLMGSFEYRYDLRAVFDDFLTMSMCAATQIPGKGKSHYEELYLETVGKYKNDNLRHSFPKLFAQLITEMENRVASDQGNDVLGDYYEQHFCKRNSGQFFTPWPICQFMSKCITTTENATSGKPLRILDPTCGSGRMLLANANENGREHEYYGIDIDHTCVKMTALNLFFNGIFHSEVMCGNALSADDFRISYAISFLPLGIFRIEDKEKSRLWHLHKNSFPERNAPTIPNIILPSDEGLLPNSGIQLDLF